MSTATITNGQCTNLFTQLFNAPFTNSMNITKGFLAHFYVSTVATSKVISISDAPFGASFRPFTLNTLLMNEPKQILILSIIIFKLTEFIKYVLTFRQVQLLRTMKVAVTCDGYELLSRLGIAFIRCICLSTVLLCFSLLPDPLAFGLFFEYSFLRRPSWKNRTNFGHVTIPHDTDLCTCANILFNAHLALAVHCSIVGVQECQKQVQSHFLACWRLSPFYTKVFNYCGVHRWLIFTI